MIVSQTYIIIRIIVDKPHPVDAAEFLRPVAIVEGPDEAIECALPIILLLHSDAQFVMVIPWKSMLIGFGQPASLPNIFLHLGNLRFRKKVSLSLVVANRLFSICIGS